MFNGAVDILIQQLVLPRYEPSSNVLIKLDDGLLEKLTGTPNAVSELLDGAEEKQLCRVGSMRLRMLPMNEAQRSKFEGDSQTSMDQMWNSLSFPNSIFLSKKEKETAEKLEKIFWKLEREVKHKGDLRSIEGIAGGKLLTVKKGPLPDEFHVYGRDADKEAK